MSCRIQQGNLSSSHWRCTWHSLSSRVAIFNNSSRNARSYEWKILTSTVLLLSVWVAFSYLFPFFIPTYFFLLMDIIHMPCSLWMVTSLLIYVVILRNNDQVSVRQDFSWLYFLLASSWYQFCFLPVLPSSSILRCSEYFGISSFFWCLFLHKLLQISWDGMAGSVFNRPGMC